MHILIIALTLSIVIFFHEIGHAFAMRSRGIPIAEISIGIPIPRLTLSFRLKRFFPGAKFSLSPLLVAAFVKPIEGAEEDIGNLSHRDSALINGSGILANFLLAILLACVYKLSTITAQSSPLAIFAFFGSTASIAAALWFWRQSFCQYALPILSLLSLVFFCYILMGNSGRIVGPIGIAQQAASLESAWKHILNVANISLGLGIFNCIPLYPMDGGRIISSILKDRGYLGLERGFRSWGLTIFIALVLSVIASDILHLF